MGAKGSDGKPYNQAELFAMKAGLRALQFRLLSHSPGEFSLALLRGAHAELAGGVKRMQPGVLRQQDITFGSFYGTVPQKIEPELEALVAQHGRRWPALQTPGDALAHATWVHAELIRIHPFWDGNGRLSRAIQAWLCWQGGSLAPIYADQTAYFAGISRYCHRQDLSLLMDTTKQALPEGEE